MRHVGLTTRERLSSEVQLIFGGRKVDGVLVLLSILSDMVSAKLSLSILF